MWGSDDHELLHIPEVRGGILMSVNTSRPTRLRALGVAYSPFQDEKKPEAKPSGFPIFASQ